jgi:hypothetical protein
MENPVAFPQGALESSSRPAPIIVTTTAAALNAALVKTTAVANVGSQQRCHRFATLVCVSQVFEDSSAADWNFNVVAVRSDRLKERVGLEVVQPPAIKFQSLLNRFPKQIASPGKWFKVGAPSPGK